MDCDYGQIKDKIICQCIHSFIFYHIILLGGHRGLELIQAALGLLVCCSVNTIRYGICMHMYVFVLFDSGTRREPTVTRGRPVNKCIIYVLISIDTDDSVLW